MLRSRVSRKPDFTRIAQAMKTPGIDPRVWVCQGYVHEFGIDEEGPFVDVICVPSEEIVPCRLASVYAGPGFGFYFPVDLNDEVLIWAPDGDPNSGLICMPRPWSASDPPPQEAIDNPQDIILHAKPGVNITLKVTGGANVLIEGEDGAAKELAYKSDVQEVVDALKNSATGSMDGGALYKTNITTSLTTSNTPTGTSILKAE